MIREELISVLKEKFGPSIISLGELDSAVSELQVKPWPNWIYNQFRISRGKYMIQEKPTNLPKPKAKKESIPSPSAVNFEKVVITQDSLNVEVDSYNQNLIPDKDPLFVPFGNFSNIKSIIASGIFYPLFVTGLSGNGKTFSIEQACAQLNREVIRVNFTVETAEDDLIGGWRLVNGDTKFFKGPVIQAMQKGSILLLDELDLANPSKVMALQSILEGKGYFIKKTGEMVQPSPGFNIVATGNTKGKGSDDGRFIGTNIMNEAFLERFPVTFEQEYPSVSIEKKILGRVFETLDVEPGEFVSKLVDWADIIRKTFADGGIDEIISTRRLVHIAKAYKIFGDKMTAIQVCINRFDEDTKLSFLDLYTKVDSEAVKEDVEVV